MVNEDVEEWPSLDDNDEESMTDFIANDTREKTWSSWRHQYFKRILKKELFFSWTDVKRRIKKSTHYKYVYLINGLYDRIRQKRGKCQRFGVF